jgi:pimeloyl-ACP methyl ester carboxylesterase
VAALLLAALALAAPAHAARPQRSGTAVVILSGLSSTTPYTTSTAQCRSGRAPAGDYGTFLLHAFTRAGFFGYTAPVQEGPGPVQDDPGQFADCPPALPAQVTVNSIGDLDRNVTAFVRFLRYLRERHGVRRVWIVAHSMGGLVSRGAIQVVAGRHSRRLPRVLGLFTLGTPHIGAFIIDLALGQLPTDACLGQTLCLTISSGLAAQASTLQPALTDNSSGFVVGSGWGSRRGRVPRSIPVLAYGADAITAPGSTDPYVFPNDGYIGLASSLPGKLKRDGVLPSLRCAPPVKDVHSLFVQTLTQPLLGITPDAIVDDPAVATSIVSALRGHPPRGRCVG